MCPTLIHGVHTNENKTKTVLSRQRRDAVLCVKARPSQTLSKTRHSRFVQDLFFFFFGVDDKATRRGRPSKATPRTRDFATVQKPPSSLIVHITEMCRSIRYCPSDNICLNTTVVMRDRTSNCFYDEKSIIIEIALNYVFFFFHVHETNEKIKIRVNILFWGSC